jgi:glycosyltransferase involved in cell wall biosynthesis
MKTSLTSITVVIPVYNEERNIPILFERLNQELARLSDINWQYLFVNDGSSDRSYDVLTKLARQYSKVQVIDLSRNFGKEVALTAGVHSAQGDAVICMDADLQHPPELIPELVNLWRKGAEVVVTVRLTSNREPFFRWVGSRFFYWIMRKISSLEMVSKTTDFRLFDRKVVEAFRRVTERERMFRGIIDWMGFRRAFVEFHADARNDGRVGYTYHKLLQLAVNSITSFSLLPLRISGYLGLVITSFSSLLLLWMSASYLFKWSYIYTPLAIVVVANTFLIGIVLVSLGLVALYIGNIHIEVTNRPLYIVRETMNFTDNQPRQQRDQVT